MDGNKKLDWVKKWFVRDRLVVQSSDDWMNPDGIWNTVGQSTKSVWRVGHNLEDFKEDKHLTLIDK